MTAEPPPPAPDPGANGRALNLHSVALNCLIVLATLFTLYAARTFLLPVVLALLFTYALSPPVRRLVDWGIPASVAAGIVVAGAVAAVILLAIALVEPATALLHETPQNLEQIREKIVDPMRASMEQVQRTSEQISEMTADGEADTVTVVRIDDSMRLEDLFLEITPTLVGMLVSMVILLYFLLAYKTVLLQKIVKVTPRLQNKKRAVEVVRSTERAVSRYLLAITVINVGLGVALAAALALTGFPDPIFWGAVAAILNFIPYLGSMFGVATLAVSAFITMDDPLRAALYPIIYMVLTVLEGNFITPMILGRSFTLNPIFIILGLLFWGWLWGIPGALLSVPLLVAFNIVCQNTPPLQSTGEILSR